jgi:hypothetical protein
MKCWDINHPKALPIHKCIAKMIALDDCLFSIVEKLGFRRLLRLLEPRYNPPSRRYFSDKVVPDMYSKIKQRIQVMIEDQPFLSFTSDMWTSITSNSSFLSLTVHWVRHDFCREHAILNVRHFENDHTGVDI